MPASTPKFCINCGAPLDPAARFCANCGFSPASVERPERPLTGLPTPAPTREVTSTSVPAEHADVEAFGATGRGRQVIFGALVAVALAVAGFVAWTVWGGSASAVAGSASPEDVVSKIVAGLEAKDPIALAAVVDPDEIVGLGQLIEGVRVKAEQIGLSEKGHEFNGISVGVSKLTPRVENVSARVARVTFVDGTLTASAEHAQLPVWLKPQIGGGSASVDLARSDQGSEWVPALMLVKEEGGWFLSPLYTAADAVATREGVLGSFPDVPANAVSEETPENAVAAFLETLARKDVDGAITRLAPAEQSAVRSYERLWREPLDDFLGSAQAVESQFAVSLSDTKVIDLPRGARGVTVESADVRYSTQSTDGDDARGTVSIESNCADLMGVRRCTTNLGGFRRGLTEDADEAVSAGADDKGRLTFVAVPTDKGYAVSLLGSAAVSANSVLGSLSPDDLAAALRLEAFRTPLATISPGQQVAVKPTLGRPVRITVTSPATVRVLWSQAGADSIREAAGADSITVYDAEGGQVRDVSASDNDDFQLPAGTFTVVRDYYARFDPTKDSIVTAQVVR